MATYTWSALTDGSTINFDPSVDTLTFDGGISAAGTFVGWTGSTVDFTAAGKTVHLTMTGVSDGGRAITDTNVVFGNGSKLLIGDNTTAIGNGTSTADDAANTLNGTSGADRFIGLGGNDTMSGSGGNDVFVLGNQGLAFGNDSVDGGAGMGDAIGVGATSAHGSIVDFNAHMVLSTEGTATFTNIENAFGTNYDDMFLMFDSSRVLTGTAADFVRFAEGSAGYDYFEGDPRSGFASGVTYEHSPSAVVVNLQQGWALDGYDSNPDQPGVQSFTDVVNDIGFVRGSAFGDLLVGGGGAF